MPSATAYLNAAMKPIYAEVICIKGKGTPQRRMETFEKRVTAMSGVWMKIHDNIEKACEKAFAENLASLERSLRDIFTSIHNKFTMLCDDVVVKSPEEQKEDEQLRAKLVIQVNEAKKMANGVVSNLAAECKGYAKQQENPMFMPED